MAEMRVMEDTMRVPEARYAYYRCCQVFRKGGTQCKAPAEKGSDICHAHAGQLATAVRRERERRAVLAEAVAQMRRRGRPECEMADLFMDFNCIQVTVAVMAQALIDGRIDCKIAGRLVVQLQTASKLLWMIHRKGRKVRKENRISPQIGADDRRLGKEKASTTRSKSRFSCACAGRRPCTINDTKEHEERPLPWIKTDDSDLEQAGEEPKLATEARRSPSHQARTGLPPRHAKTAPGVDAGEEQPRAERSRTANEREATRIALLAEVWAIVHRSGWAHAPPELLRAA